MFFVFYLSGVNGGYDWIMDSMYQIAMSKPINFSQGHISFYPFRKHHTLINGFNVLTFMVKNYIDRKLLFAIQPDFTKIIIEAINNNYYISTFLNKDILLGGEGDTFHPSYIFGYDSAKRTFLISDNFYNGKNGVLEADFSVVQRAYESAVQTNAQRKGNRVVYFYHLNENFSHKFSKDRLTHQIENYLSSTGEEFVFPDNNMEMIAYGLDTYQKLYEQIEGITTDHIDFRNFTFICDVVSLTKQRIDFLIEKRIIPFDQHLLDSVNEQNKFCEILVMLCIKYNIKRDSGIKDRVLSYINQVRINEERIGYRLLELTKAGKWLEYCD